MLAYQRVRYLFHIPLKTWLKHVHGDAGWLQDLSNGLIRDSKAWTAQGKRLQIHSRGPKMAQAAHKLPPALITLEAFRSTNKKKTRSKSQQITQVDKPKKKKV